MTTILNYLKGNYLISNFSFLTTVESGSSFDELSQKLISYSISHNKKAADRFICFNIFFRKELFRNIIIINMGITSNKNKHFSFNITKENNSNSSGKLIYWLENSNVYFIPVKKHFLKSTKYNDFIHEKEGLISLIDILKNGFPQRN